MIPASARLSKNEIRLKRVFEMQRANIFPVQLSADSWRVPSLSKPGTVHTVHVWLARAIAHADAIGAALDATCSCPARGDCKHILAVRLEYNRDARLVSELERAVAA